MMRASRHDARQGDDDSVPRADTRRCRVSALRAAYAFMSYEDIDAAAISAIRFRRHARQDAERNAIVAIFRRHFTFIEGEVTVGATADVVICARQLCAATPPSPRWRYAGDCRHKIAAAMLPRHMPVRRGADARRGQRAACSMARLIDTPRRH